MTEEKKPDIYQYTLTDHINNILVELKNFSQESRMGISIIDLIEICKLGTLQEIAERIDSYIAERIETDKTVLSILRDIESRAIVVQFDPKINAQAALLNDHGKRIAALEDKIEQTYEDH